MPLDLDSSEIAERSAENTAAQQAGQVTVEEVRGSRVGSVNGIFGSFPVRRFKVRNFQVDEDPRDVLRNHQYGVKEGQLAPYPLDAANGVVALMLRIIEHSTPRSAEIEVDYGPPIFFPSLPEKWSVDFEGGLETEEVLVDLEGKPVGTPKYDELAFLDRGTVGPVDATHTVDYGDKILYLRRSTDDTRYGEPMPRMRDAHRVVLWKRIGVMDEGKIGLLLDDAFNKVNDDTLRALTIFRNTPLVLGGRNRFRWVGSNLTYEPGYAIGQSVAGVLIRVTVVLEYNPNGHQWNQHHKIPSSETGTIGFVRDSQGNLVKETWKRYELRNFTSILAQI